MNTKNFGKTKVSALLALLLVLLPFSVNVSNSVAASSSFTVNPTTFSAGTYSGYSTVAYVSGGSFVSGSTVYFFLSTTPTSSGIVPNSGTYLNGVSNAIGYVVLSSGSESLSNQVSFTMYSGAVPGKYYILAEDYVNGVPSGTYITGPQVTIVQQTPTVTVQSPVQVGETVAVTGSGFDPGSSVSLYLNYPGSSQVLGSATASSTGSFKAYITVPALSGTISSSGSRLAPSYVLVAQETDALSASFPCGGITSDAHFDVAPSITVTPADVNGKAGTSFTITGNGFVAGQQVSGFSSASTGTSAIAIYNDYFNVLLSNTYYSGFTVSSDGSFSVTVTLASTVSSTGPLGIAVSLTNPSAQDEFSSSIYVSIPSINQGTLVLYDVKKGSSAGGYVGDSLLVTVYNFPANSVVNVYMDGVNLGPLSTDANGYASAETSVPEVPGSYSGTPYTVYAITTNGVTGYNAKVTFYVYSNAYSTTMSPGMYIPSGAVFTIYAYGLDPTQLYHLSISGASFNATAISVSTGTLSVASPTGIYVYPSANGALTLSVPITYSGTIYTGASTAIIELLDQQSNDVLGASYSGPGSFNLYLVGQPKSNYFPDTNGMPAEALPSGTVTVTISNLIPSTATNLYPGLSNKYVMFIGTTQVTFSNGNNYFQASSGSTATLKFTAPSSTGVPDVYVDYYGTSPSNAASSAIDFFVLAVSSPGTTPKIYVGGSSTLSYVHNGYAYFIAINMPASSSTAGIIIAGNGAYSVNSGTDSYGVIMRSVSLQEYPAGTYMAYAVSNTGSSAAISTPLASTSFTVLPSMWISNSYPVPENYGPVNTEFPVYAFGLSPNTLYYLWFGKIFAGQAYSDNGGYLSAQVTVPCVPAGTYNVSVTLPTSMSSIVSMPFAVIQNPNVELSTMSQYAFPGQKVSVTVYENSQSPVTLPTGLYPVAGGTLTTYSIDVYLNGSLFTVIPATEQTTQSGEYAYSGTFIMPNDLEGSYYEAEYVPVITESGTFSYTLSVASSSSTYSGVAYTYGSFSASQTPQYDYLGLASGNGALLTGITPSQMATLETAISSDITTTMQVPLSELNASVTSINNAVATIKTSFGTMEASLQALNASVVSISNNVATLKTDLGTVQTSLNNLNATVVSISHGVATLNTAVGQVQTSLSNLNATVVSISDGVATLKTSIGTVQTSVNNLGISLSELNSTVVSRSSSISSSISTLSNTISSSFSSLNASVNGISSTLSSDYRSLSSALSSISSSLSGVSSTLSGINSATASTSTTLSSLSSASRTVTTYLLVIAVLAIIIITLELVLLLIKK